MRGSLGRVLGLALVALLTVGGLVALSDATRFRGQASEGGETTVEVRVEAKNYHHDLEDAAASLWYACVGAVNWESATPPRATTSGTFTASIRPALGEDSRRRFRGCLEDATVDKVHGDVVAMASDPDASAPPG